MKIIREEVVTYNTYNSYEVDDAFANDVYEHLKKTFMSEDIPAVTPQDICAIMLGDEDDYNPELDAEFALPNNGYKYSLASEIFDYVEEFVLNFGDYDEEFIDGEGGVWDCIK